MYYQNFQQSHNYKTVYCKFYAKGKTFIEIRPMQAGPKLHLRPSKKIKTKSAQTRPLLTTPNPALHPLYHSFHLSPLSEFRFLPILCLELWIGDQRRKSSRRHQPQIEAGGNDRSSIKKRGKKKISNRREVHQWKGQRRCWKWGRPAQTPHRKQIFQFLMMFIA